MPFVSLNLAKVMIAVKQQQAPRFYEFGPFRVDTVKCALLRDGRTLPLSAKAFEVLLVLLQHPGQVLEKDELLKEIWCDTLVEENNLARQISALRKTLDEHPNEHQYILTVPGRGYRFVASVEQLDRERELPSLEALDRLKGNAAVVETQAYVDQSAAVLHHAGPTSRSEVKRFGLGLRVGSTILGVLLLATVVVTALIRQTRPANGPLPQPRLWQLTFDSGLEDEPTWSPDGNLLAYSSDRSGNFDIWVRPVGEGNPVQVTTSPAHDWQPDWAPEGNRLVFRSERDGGGLFVVPVLGGTERRISSFGYRPRWSPDGTHILFYSSILENVVETPKVYVVGLDGNPPREVLGEFLTEFDSLRVAWHPDGRISLWGNHRKQGWSFWTLSMTGVVPIKSEFDTKVKAQLKESGVSFTDFQWSSDGRALYFDGVSQSVKNLWRVGIDPNSVRWIAGPDRLTTGTGLDTDMALSRDGRKLAFTSRSQRTRLWSLPFDAVTGRVKGEGQPITATGRDALFPDLSVDGTKLVYVALHAGRGELWAKRLKDHGGETLLITPDDSSSILPRWSRDGSRLAYRRLLPATQERSEVERTIMLVSTDGRDEQMLTSLGKTVDMPWDWSADGKWILGGSERESPGRHALYLFPIAAAPHAEEQMRVVTSHPEDNLWQARFSPDNRWISFCAAKAIEAGVSTIYVVPASGGEWTLITEGKYFDDKPRWSPDGKTLYFVSNRTGFFNVWGIRFDSANGRPTGEPFRVTDFESPAQKIVSDPKTLEIAISADRLVLPIMEDSGDIWILENVGFSGAN